MNKVFRHDLLKHFFVGFFIYVICAIAGNELFALVMTMIIAVGKELIYDKIMGKGKAEGLDILYTVLPGLLLYLFYHLK